MFICENCEKVFEEAKTIYESHPYGMGYAREEFSVCPYCEATEIVKAKECEHCGEFVAETTDGLCDICYEDMYE